MEDMGHSTPRPTVAEEIPADLDNKRPAGCDCWHIYTVYCLISPRDVSSQARFNVDLQKNVPDPFVTSPGYIWARTTSLLIVGLLTS